MRARPHHPRSSPEASHRKLNRIAAMLFRIPSGSPFLLFYQFSSKLLIQFLLKSFCRLAPPFLSLFNKLLNANPSEFSLEAPSSFFHYGLIQVLTQMLQNFFWRPPSSFPVPINFKLDYQNKSARILSEAPLFH